MKIFHVLRYLIFMTILLTLFSCGQYAGNNDYAGGGIGGTGITGVSVGKVTAIDLPNSSISVNGVSFSLNGTGVKVNGTTADIANLKVGMIVKVNGEFDKDGSTGKALTIDFENNIEGPVDIGSKDLITKATFKVLGKTILVDTGTKYEKSDSAASFDDLIEGNIVEVSGFEDGDGSIHATYIELKEETFQQGTTQVELKGTISNVNTALNTFVLNNITIAYDPNKINESILTDGANIEVKGIISTDNNNTLVADKVELHDFTPTVKEGEKIEIEGYITEITPSTNSTIYFNVNNQTVFIDTSKTTFEHGTISDVQINIKVEVKGTIKSGVLVAREISIESEKHKENDKIKDETSDANKDVGTAEDKDTNADLNPDISNSQINDSTINNSTIDNNDNNIVANQDNSGDDQDDVETNPSNDKDKDHEEIDTEDKPGDKPEYKEDK